MGSRPTFTIIIRTCGRDTVAEAVASVARQACRDWEILFLVDNDGHHPEGNMLWANSQFDKHKGAINGRYCLALDDDDIFENPGFLSSAMDAIRNGGSPDVVLVRSKMTKKGGGYEILPSSNVWGIDWESGARPARWYGQGYNWIVRSDVFAKYAKHYSQRNGGDWHFMTALIHDSVRFVRCDVLGATALVRNRGKKSKGAESFYALREIYDIKKDGDVYRLNSDSLSDNGIKILSLAEWDHAGVGYQLSCSINSETKIVSRAIRWHTSYINFPHDVVMPSQGEIEALYKQADVIHIHDAFNHLPDELEKKPTVITYHGSMYRRSPDIYNALCKEKYFLPTVATIDLRLLGGAEWLPDARHASYFSDCATHKKERFTVCHSPTKRAVKNTETVIAACKKLGVGLELIEGASWAECVRKKSECHILVDQLTLGYGCNAIEAWALGMPVIANAADAKVKDAMLSEFGGELPFMPCDNDSDMLADAIAVLMDDKAAYEQNAERGHAHYQKYHSPAASAIAAVALYNKAIDLFYSIPILEDRAAPAIRYIGSNHGTEVYYGASGKRYRFGKKIAPQAVPQDDLDFFLGLKDKRGRPLFQVVK